MNLTFTLDKELLIYYDSFYYDWIYLYNIAFCIHINMMK